MKDKTTIVVILALIFCFVIPPLRCHKAKYKRDDYIGVYYYDLVARTDRLLDYIILYQDGKYYHKASDGHEDKGKWTYTKYKDTDEIQFDEPIHCVKEEKSNYSSTIYCSPDKLRFEIDLDVDFYRVDSVKAREMGIKAENVIWDMGTRDDNFFTRLYDCSMCCANIGFYIWEILMFATAANQE